MRTSHALVLAGALILAAPATAGQINVIGLAYEPLEMFPSSDENAVPAGTATASDLSFPLPIKAASRNGMFKITVEGRDVWVIADDVETDSEVSLQAGCEPEMVGATISFGARGLGEGCE